MKPLMIGGLAFGEGMAKICIPIAYASEKEILEEAGRIGQEPAADLAEWRIDWYEGVWEKYALTALLPKVKEALAGKPLLVTFRSKQEGGEQEIAPQTYETLLNRVIDCKAADLLDIELSAGEAQVSALMQRARSAGTAVILSKHDFKKTPSVSEMLSILEQMYQKGADICKLAVMPHSTADTAALLEVTARMQERFPQSLLVTMSMGKTGMVSRICGGFFGSVMTFGCLGKASAPGQVSAEALKQALTALQACESRE